MDGVKLPCPAGRFGTSAQETSPLCSDVCPSGFFCSEGSARFVLRRPSQLLDRAPIICWLDEGGHLNAHDVSKTMQYITFNRCFVHFGLM